MQGLLRSDRPFNSPLVLGSSREGVGHYTAGDKRHLLALKKWKGIRIISPSEFIRRNIASEAMERPGNTA